MDIAIAMKLAVRIRILKEVQTTVERCRVRLLDWRVTDNQDDAQLVADELQEVMHRVTSVLTSMERETPNV